MTDSNIIFFDFDGTLVNSMNQYLIYYNDYARRYGKPIIDADKYVRLRKKTFNTVRKELKLNLFEAFFINRLLKKQVYQNPELIEPFPGIVNLIKNLKEKGYLIYIISSNTQKNIQKILDFYYIDCVDKIIHTFRSFNKTFFIKKYLKRNKKFHRVFVISDEYKDIKVANKLNLISIAVNWGANHFEADNLIKPNYIVNSVDELSLVILEIDKSKLS